MNSLNRGNIVKILFGGYGWSSDEGDYDTQPEIVGKEAVIEYSYGQKYENGNNIGDYAIMFLDNGCFQAWFRESQLEFISEGGEHVINECKQKYENLVKKITDLKWIKENYNADDISSGSILKLFNEIDYNSSFNRNGEFFDLFKDWNKLSPIFTFVFNNDIKAAISYTSTIFKSEYKNKYEQNVIKFYSKVQQL